jgi:hypothetical protein
MPSGQRRGDPGEEGLHLSIDNDRVQAFLAAEVFIDHRRAHAGPGGDLLDRRRFESLLREQ